MSKTLRLLTASVLTVVVQTTLVQYIRIMGVVPDMMIALLTAVTTYCGPYGGFCVAAVMALFYDASVGYVMAINLVSYVLVGVLAPMLRRQLNKNLHIPRFGNALILMIIGFLMTISREMVDIGYLFIIGSDMGLTTILRALLCSAYTAVMTLPVSFLLKRLMGWHPHWGFSRNIPNDSRDDWRNDL